MGNKTKFFSLKAKKGGHVTYGNNNKGKNLVIKLLLRKIVALFMT